MTSTAKGKKRGQSGFVRDLLPVSPNLIFTEVGPSSLRMRRAFVVAHKSTPFLKMADLAVALKILNAKRREQICDQYWRRKWDNERPTLAQVKPYATKFAASLDKLISDWEQSPLFVQNAMWSLLDDNPEDITIGSFLHSLRSACYEVSYADGEPGRKKPDHLDLLAEELCQLWTEITKRSVPKTLTGTTIGDAEFISPAPQFILTLAKSVDDNIGFNDIRNALRRRQASIQVQQ